MKIFDTDFREILNMVFGKTFDTECEYKSMCSAYQNSSHTCTDAVDKNYCGIYKIFLK
jgi:hypothetical protein